MLFFFTLTKHLTVSGYFYKMFALEKDLDDQTFLVPKKMNKRKIQNPTDHLQNVKKEKRLCQSSNTRNFVSYAKKNSLIKIGDETKKALMTVSKKGDFLSVFKIICNSFD